MEQQGHGRTADIDRPMSVQAMADDTLALLAHLGIGQADLFGYSLGAGIALNIITNHPAVVRKAVLASVTYDKTSAIWWTVAGLIPVTAVSEATRSARRTL